MAAPDSKYSIVLVLRPFSHHSGKEHGNIERFCDVGMQTFERFMDVRDVEEFFVVVPRPDVRAVEDVLRTRFPSWPWRVLNEDSLLEPSIPPGWARQQTCKLAIAPLVRTPTYLIVDDDTYLTRPFAARDMRDAGSGKLLLNRTDIDFPMFFLWSAQLLEYDIDLVQGRPHGHMAITPEIFVTGVVRDLVRDLVARYGDKKAWQAHIVKHKYTEYCLYWIWLLKQGLAGDLYALDSPMSLYGYATTGPEHDAATRVRQSFEENQMHYFSFVQSSLPIPVAKVREMVERAMGPGPDPGAPRMQSDGGGAPMRTHKKSPTR